MCAFANPFTQQKNSPVPVYHEQPNASVVQGMRALTEKLSTAIEQWKTTRDKTFLFLTIAIAFAYGFIHALAPGHRKIVVFSYFLAKSAHPLQPALLGFVLAFVHALSAFVLLVVFKSLVGALSNRTNDITVYLEGATYILLIALSTFGIIEALFSLRQKSQTHEKKITLLGIILSSLYPCPAAMLILVFAININVFALGIIALASLSLGMSIPIIASGYLAWAGRLTLFARLKNHEQLIAIVSAILQILAFSLLLVISARIALPFILGFFVHR